MKSRSRQKQSRQNATSDHKTFLEFFAGMGLVREALLKGGWECVYANDNDPRKQALYEERFGLSERFHNEDVRRTKEIIQRIENQPFLATASFPCNDLSVAGHYKGFRGKKSSTFFAFISVVKALGDRRPKVILLENVMGMLTARNGQDFKKAVLALAGLGYWLDAFVLNASHFTPQSRARVFVIGVQKDLRPGEVVGAGRPLPTRPAELTNDRLENFIRTAVRPAGAGGCGEPAAVRRPAFGKRSAAGASGPSGIFLGCYGWSEKRPRLITRALVLFSVKLAVCPPAATGLLDRSRQDPDA